ncbi:MAG: hypothetical protein ACHQJ6_01125 [Candidatus Berkiellales bacterium]
MAAGTKTKLLTGFLLGTSIATRYPGLIQPIVDTLAPHNPTAKIASPFIVGVLAAITVLLLDPLYRLGVAAIDGISRLCRWLYNKASNGLESLKNRGSRFVPNQETVLGSSSGFAISTAMQHITPIPEPYKTGLDVTLILSGGIAGKKLSESNQKGKESYWDSFSSSVSNMFSGSSATSKKKKA